jgi:hypothetical protein
MICAGIHSEEHGLYRMLAIRFPYAIHDEVDEAIAYIAAVLPMRRNPSWIRKELAGTRIIRPQPQRCSKIARSTEFSFAIHPN